VIGVHDRDGEEVPKAFVARRDVELGAEDVLSFVAERVAPHKKIRLVEFVDQIPKSPSGKILRKALRER
jgi:acyl-coenzyme A synthetase/AMP-(fatty) acid ligase